MSFRRFLLFTLVLTLAGFLLSSTATFAQSFTTGEISGTVTDPSGAVLPNVTVTLKSVEKGNTQSGTTNSQGAYRFSLLSPGNYTVSATAPGFKTTTVAATSIGRRSCHYQCQDGTWNDRSDGRGVRRGPAAAGGQLRNLHYHEYVGGCESYQIRAMT